IIMRLALHDRGSRWERPDQMGARRRPHNASYTALSLAGAPHGFFVPPHPMAQAAALAGHPCTGLAGVDLAGGAGAALRAAVDLGSHGVAPVQRVGTWRQGFPAAPTLGAVEKHIALGAAGDGG